MASSIWWPLLIVLFILGIFFNIHLLSAFALMLAVLSALARFWQRRSLLNVTYRRSPYYRRGFPGEIGTNQAGGRKPQVLTPFLAAHPRPVAPRDWTRR